MTDPNLIRVEGTERTFHRLKVLAVLLLPLSMSLMALSAVNVALPTIEVGLGASPTDVQWILSGYALAFGVSLIPAGRAGDVLGRGTWFLIGLVLFLGASLVCGLAPNPLVLNAARIVQGVGAGIFSPQVTGMIQQYFTGQGRAKAFALFGLVISASVAVGPVLTGTIIQAIGPEDGWRWAFFIYIPIGLLAVVLGLLWFPFENERRRRAGAPELVGRKLDLDPVGSVILTLAILCLMFPFMAHAAWAWWLLPAAPVLAWLWVRWERAYAARGGAPMVDLSLFAYRSFRNGMLVSGTMFLGVASTFAVGAIFLQSGLGVAVVLVGLVGLPNAIVSAFSSVWSVRYVLSHGRQLIVAMLLLMATGTLLSIGVGLLVPHGAPWWLLSLTLMLNGFGMGVVGSANQTLAMQDVPPQHGGTAGGIKQTVERIGAALGNAMVVGVLFTLVPRGWTTAFAGAYGMILVCILAAAALAVLDERQHRRPVGPSAAAG
ncbi:MFS transporter [Propionibacteriaceae bacterium Y1923]|uniref:MFS transporter n=1 Tax=Aestuariimicrobium sp. Y1814 TaxID=3418742 RepID=UPI003C25F3B8